MLPVLGSSMNFWMIEIIAVAMAGSASRSMNWATALHLPISVTDFFWIAL